MEKKNVEEPDYKKLFFEEKMAKLKTEATLLQFKFQQIQEQIQLVNVELLKLKKEDTIKQTVDTMRNTYENFGKEENLQPE